MDNVQNCDSYAVCVCVHNIYIYHHCALQNPSSNAHQLLEYAGPI
jgi:hypothetical protein